MIRLCLHDARHALQRLFHPRLAVLAHHALDLQYQLALRRRGLDVANAFDRRAPRQLDPQRLRVRAALAPFVMARVAQLEEVQPQRVRDHAEARQAHRRRAEHRVQRPAEQGDVQPRRQGDADHIVEEGPEQVLVDVSERRAAEADGRRHVAQPALHQHHVRGVDGHVRARADGDADVRAGERRGVVDAVADHGDPAILLELADHRLLAVREHAGHDLVHAGLRADGLRRALVVAGQHHHADAHVPELADGLRAVLLDDVGHGDDARRDAVLEKQQRRLALVRERLRPRRQGFRQSGQALDELQAAAGERRAALSRLHAAPRQGPEARDLADPQVARLRLAHHGASQGMLAVRLHGRGQGKQRRLVKARRRDDVRHARLALGDGAGLVQGDHVHLARLLQGDGGLEEDAVLRA